MPQSIEVEFPDGPRVIPAYPKVLVVEDCMGKSYQHVMTPEPLDGWIFCHNFDGSWKAYEDNR